MLHCGWVAAAVCLIGSALQGQAQQAQQLQPDGASASGAQKQHTALCTLLELIRFSVCGC